jgi:hypothetical protein
MADDGGRLLSAGAALSCGHRSSISGCSQCRQGASRTAVTLCRRARGSRRSCTARRRQGRRAETAVSREGPRLAKAGGCSLVSIRAYLISPTAIRAMTSNVMTTAYGTTISVAVRRGDVRSERELPEREVPRHVRFIRVRAGPAVRDRSADLSRGGRRCLRISPAWLGSRPAAERDRGFLILAIADPLDHPDPEATVARYMLGFWAVPARPGPHHPCTGTWQGCTTCLLPRWGGSSASGSRSSTP